MLGKSPTNRKSFENFFLHLQKGLYVPFKKSGFRAKRFTFQQKIQNHTFCFIFINTNTVCKLIIDEKVFFATTLSVIL